MKHRKNMCLRLSITLLLASILWLGMGTPVLASDTTVSVTPANRQVDHSQVFTVEIVVSPAVAIAGVQFDLTFDTTLLTVTTVTEGNLLKQDGASTYFAMMNTIVNANTTGTIKATGVTIGEGQTVSSTDTFAIMTFTAKTNDGTSNLTLSNVKVGDAGGNPVAIQVNNGTVTVGTVAQPGDANGDGNRNALDITKVERIIAGLDTETPGADANQDGEMNALDITKTERLIAGLD